MKELMDAVRRGEAVARQHALSLEPDELKRAIAALVSKADAIDLDELGSEVRRMVCGEQLTATLENLGTACVFIELLEDQGLLLDGENPRSRLEDIAPSLSKMLATRRWRRLAESLREAMFGDHENSRMLSDMAELTAGEIDERIGPRWANLPVLPKGADEPRRWIARSGEHDPEDVSVEALATWIRVARMVKLTKDMVVWPSEDTTSDDLAMDSRNDTPLTSSPEPVGTDAAAFDSDTPVKRSHVFDEDPPRTVEIPHEDFEPMGVRPTQRPTNVSVIRESGAGEASEHGLGVSEVEAESTLEATSRHVPPIRVASNDLETEIESDSKVGGEDLHLESTSGPDLSILNPASYEEVDAAVAALACLVLEETNRPGPEGLQDGHAERLCLLLATRSHWSAAMMLANDLLPESTLRDFIECGRLASVEPREDSLARDRRLTELATAPPNPDTLSRIHPRLVSGAAMMLAACALEDALYSKPNVWGSTFKQLPFGAGRSKLMEMMSELGEILVRGVPLTRELLATGSDASSLGRRLVELCSTVTRRREETSKRTMSLQRATEVWRQMTLPTGLVGESAALMSNLPHEAGGIVRLQEIIEILEDKKQLEQEVERLNQHIKRGAEPIQAKALDKIVRQAKEWAELCRDVSKLREDFDQTNAGSHRHKHADRVRETLRIHLKGALVELEEASRTDAWAAAGARVLMDVLARVDPTTRILTSRPDLGDALDVARIQALEWLGHEGFAYDDSGGLLRPYDWSDLDAPAHGLGAFEQVSGARVALKALCSGPSDPSIRLETTIARGDLVTAYQLFDWLGLHDEDGELSRRLERLDDEHRVRLGDELERVEELNHRALREGLLVDREAETFMGLLGDTRHRLRDRTQTQRYDELDARLVWLDKRLEEKFEEQVDSLTTRLSRLSRREDPPTSDLERARAELDAGHLRTAEEYLGLLEASAPLPQLTRQDRFEQFFDRSFDSRTLELQESGISRVLGRLRRRAKLGDGMDFSELTEARAQEGLGALEAWRTMGECVSARCEPSMVDHVRTIFEFLGFEDVLVDPYHEESEGSIKPEFALKTTPIADRALCPLPAFGSRANGRYYVYVNTRRQKPGELVETVERPTTQACFVLHPELLNGEQRRELAKVCHAHKKTLVVLDTHLLCWLATLDVSRRLRYAFDAALPFTWATPFEDYAGDVAPELFYGRRDEIRRICNEMKGGVIYGGRQLGKTALLRHIAATHDDSYDRQHFLFSDLRTSDLMLDSKRFANFLRELLRDVEVPRDGESIIPRNLTSATSTAKLLGHVARYLAEHPTAQIVLLLDEADEFLSADEKGGYAEVREITKAQVRTNGRFRVFFAGLHDVQRSVKEKNHPLAHMSNSINIGPLYEGGEHEQALALLTEPLSSLGYRFDESGGDLPMAVLTYTNFYPSLIQLFGLRLLEHMHRGGNTAWMDRRSPPYVIDRTHVEGALESEQLHRQIQAKFRLTLQLDPRYEFLAYAVVALASGSLGLADPGGGVSIEALHETGRERWPQAFAHMERRALKVLLDEMVGLGVLKRVEPLRGDTRYALRNSNVARNLGTLAQIHEELDKPHKPLVSFDKDTCRMPMSEGLRLSPWTLRRNDEIARPNSRPVVVCGPRGAGLEDVETWLRSMAYVDVRKLERGSADHAGMLEVLSRSEFGASQLEAAVTFLVLDEGEEWSLDTLTTAHGKLSSRTSTTHFLRPVFLLGEERAWELCERPELRERLEQYAEVFELRPIHRHGVRHWARETEFGVPPDEAVDDLVELLGVYPGTLAWFEREAHGHDWAERRDWLHERICDVAAAEELLDLLGAPRGSGQRVALTEWLETKQARPRLRSWLDLMGMSVGDEPLVVRPCLEWCLEVAK